MVATIERRPPACRRSIGSVSGTFTKDDDEEHRARDGEGQEDAAPGGEAKDHRSDLRGDDRTETGDQHEGREESSRGRTFEQIAHDGPGDHHTGRTPDALEEPESVEHEHRRGHAAGQRGDDEEAQPDKEGPPPPLAVADGPDDQLAECDADKAPGHRELDRRRAGVKIRADPRQCRQIHVDAQGSENRQPADDEDQPPSTRDAGMGEKLRGCGGWGDLGGLVTPGSVRWGGFVMLVIWEGSW